MAGKALKPHSSAQIPKAVVFVARLLEWLSPVLASRFAARLFTTPMRYKRPKRELEIDRNSRQQRVLINSLNREIVVYEYGNSERKILLVHGWSGRGTQLVRFAERFLAGGYSTVSFDAPAHGKSPGRTTLMPEFVEAILQLDAEFGPFDGAIGHSLGGMSLLNAAKQGFYTKKMVVIGSGDVIQDIIDDFISRLGLRDETGQQMRARFEKNGETMDSYSSFVAAQHVTFPVLVIHDQADAEVPATCARHIVDHLPNGRLLLTSGLGHRKILGNHAVIEATFKFITS